jgi:hypothetical protein
MISAISGVTTASSRPLRSFTRNRGPAGASAGAASVAVAVPAVAPLPAAGSAGSVGSPGVPSRSTPRGGPCMVRWYISRMYSAARIMPVVARIVNTGRAGNAPISTRNSLTKLFVPGRASEARPATKKAPPSSGAAAETPP